MCFGCKKKYLYVKQPPAVTLSFLVRALNKSRCVFLNFLNKPIVCLCVFKIARGGTQWLLDLGGDSLYKL